MSQRLCGSCHQDTTGWTPMGKGHFDARIGVCDRCSEVALLAECACVPEQEDAA